MNKLDEIRARLNKATPGPWAVWQLACESDPCERTVVTTDDGEDEICGILNEETNANFIAHAPADLEFLLAEVKQLREALAPGDGLNASEALYMLVGWMTTRSDSIILGSQHDASEAANIVGQFCKQFNLPDPRLGWPDRLPAFKYPVEPPQTEKGEG